MSDRIFDSTVNALNQSLNLRLLNQNVISANIANADTPGYKAQAVEFEAALRDALQVGGELPMAGNHAGHQIHQDTSEVTAQIYADPNGIESLDGNTVDRSAEMAKLAQNQLLYDASIEVLKKKLKQTEYAITEGGGNR